MEEIISKAVLVLKKYGTEIIDNSELELYYDKAVLSLMSILNVDEIATELYNVCADMTAGLYLKDKIYADGEYRTVKSMTQGDVSISFENGSSELDFITALIKPSEEIIARYRGINW